MSNLSVAGRRVQGSVSSSASCDSDRLHFAVYRDLQQMKKLDGVIQIPCVHPLSSYIHHYGQQCAALAWRSGQQHRLNSYTDRSYPRRRYTIHCSSGCTASYQCGISTYRCFLWSVASTLLMVLAAPRRLCCCKLQYYRGDGGASSAAKAASVARVASFAPDSADV